MIARLLPPERREWAANVFVGSVTVTAAIIALVWLVGTLVLGLGRELAWLVGWM